MKKEDNTPASPGDGSRWKWARPFQAGAFRYSAVELLIALLLLFLATPFVQTLPHGGTLETVLVSGVMVSAVLAVGGRRRTLVIALLLATPALAARWINHVRAGTVSPTVFLVCGMVFFLFVIAHLVIYILHAPRVDAGVLCAGISGHLMMGLLWMLAYMLVDYLSPAAFSITVGPEAGRAFDGFTAFYFSFITLCTVGYGDVVPVSKVARMLAVMESIAGLFYITVMISRLVAVYSSKPVETGEEKNR
jgi:hypothetical protein